MGHHPHLSTPGTRARPRPALRRATRAGAVPRSRRPRPMPAMTAGAWGSAGIPSSPTWCAVGYQSLPLQRGCLPRCPPRLHRLGGCCLPGEGAGCVHDRATRGGESRCMQIPHVVHRPSSPPPLELPRPVSPVPVAPSLAQPRWFILQICTQHTLALQYTMASVTLPSLPPYLHMRRQPLGDHTVSP